MDSVRTISSHRGQSVLEYGRVMEAHYATYEPLTAVWVEMPLCFEVCLCLLEYGGKSTGIVHVTSSTSLH